MYLHCILFCLVSTSREVRGDHPQVQGERNGGAGGEGASQAGMWVQGGEREQEQEPEQTGWAKGQRRSSPAPQLGRAEGCQWGQGGEPPPAGPREQGRGGPERQAHGP